MNAALIALAIAAAYVLGCALERYGVAAALAAVFEFLGLGRD